MVLQPNVPFVSKPAKHMGHRKVFYVTRLQIRTNTIAYFVSPLMTKKSFIGFMTGSSELGEKDRERDN